MEAISEGIVKLSISTNSVVRIEEVIYALKYNFNLISLGQLKKTGIIYYNKKSYITLKRNKTTIVKVFTVKNLFLLNIITSTTLAVKEKLAFFYKATKKKKL